MDGRKVNLTHIFKKYGKKKTLKWINDYITGIAVVRQLGLIK